MDHTSRKEAEQIANKVMDLYEDMLFIHKHNLFRNAAQINNIIRYSMMGMAVTMGVMLALVATFTTRMDEITAYMATINYHMTGMREDFDQVTTSMRSMEKAVLEMEGFVAPMPAMYNSVQAMGANMQTLRGNLVTLAESMERIQNRMLSMGGNLQQMDRKLIDLSGAVGGIGQEVDRMARPMAILPTP